MVKDYNDGLQAVPGVDFEKGKYKAEVVDIDGNVRERPDFPTAIIRRGSLADEGNFVGDIVDPVFTDKIARNLYGRIMTLVEATTEQSRLKAVKDVFSKELRAWESDVFNSAREITQMPETNGHVSHNNLYM